MSSGVDDGPDAGEQIGAPDRTEAVGDLSEHDAGTRRAFRVTTKEGTPIEYREFNLRFKTDSGPDGPPPGTPVVIKVGMRGDRAFVVFSTPDEISAFIKSQCKES